MTIVCFACVHNAGRSQMAAALWNALGDATRRRAIAAGTEPARVHLDWPLSDLKGQPLETVRAIVDDIERRVRALLVEKRLV